MQKVICLCRASNRLTQTCRAGPSQVNKPEENWLDFVTMLTQQHRTREQLKRGGLSGRDTTPSPRRQDMQLWMTRMGAFKLAMCFGQRGYESRLGQQSLFLLDALTALCHRSVLTEMIDYSLWRPGARPAPPRTNGMRFFFPVWQGTLSGVMQSPTATVILLHNTCGCAKRGVQRTRIVIPRCGV